MTRGGGSDLLNTGGVEVLNTVPVSVNWDCMDAVTWVGRLEGIESDSLGSVAVSAELAVSGGSDFVDVGGVEVVNSVEVSVNWDSLDSVTWVTVGQSVESNTFRSVVVVTELSRSGGTDFARVSGVEVVSAVPVSEDWDLGNLDWNWVGSDDWGNMNVVNCWCRSDLLFSGGVVMMMMGHVMMMMVVGDNGFLSLNNLRLFLHSGNSLVVMVHALGLCQTDQKDDQESRNDLVHYDYN